jgi:hypothetical protein
MRRAIAALQPAFLFSLLVLGVTRPALSQRRGPPLQAASNRDTTSDTSSVLPGVPFVMRRADAIVGMAQSAPSIAPTVRTTRVASVSAQQASRALEDAHAAYDAGHYAIAVSEATRAIGLARMAIAVAMQDLPTALEAQSAGDVIPSVLPPNIPPVTTLGLTPTQGPPVYRSLYSQPFGANPAGLGAPLMRDSTPFGAEPIQPSRGLPPAGLTP